MELTLEQFGLDQLDAEQARELKTLLVMSLTQGSLPLSPHQEAELARRIDHARANPGEGTPRATVRDRLLLRAKILSDSTDTKDLPDQNPTALEQYGLDQLSRDEKSQLLVLLDDTYSPREDFFESPELLDELRRRVALMDADPSRGVPWETVRDAARERSRARRGR